jgi:excisionase family DNA binding protein
MLSAILHDFTHGDSMAEKLTYTIAEVCSAGNFGRTTAYAAIRAGSLRAVKVGRRTIVLANDLNDFLQNLPQVHPKTAAK